MLDNYKLEYEDLPLKLNTRISGGKGRKMSKQAEATPVAKTSKKYQKTRGEHAKDILIAILVTAVIAFIGGMQFSDKQQAQIDKAVQAVASPKVEATPSK